MLTRQTMVLAMIAVLAASSPAMVACQAQEDAMTTQEGTTNQDATTASSSTVKPETFSTLTAWGSNFFGQLGNGSQLPYGTPSTTPVEVSGLEGAALKAICAGQNHSLALKNDGTVLAWGSNTGGQLGDGTNTDSSMPVQVKDSNDPSGYLTGVNAIAAGSGHSLALKGDGTVWAWGDNGSGQLGNGTITSSNTPTQVDGLDGVEAIAGGSSYSLALKNDGTVWAWGSNTSGQEQRISGQLGTNVMGINTPVQVSELSGVKAIAAGGDHSLAGW